MGQSTWGVTPRNSFSRETRTQDKADGQLQKRIFVKSLCAHSEGTHITSLKSCPKCEPSLSLHLLQALQPSSNLVQFGRWTVVGLVTWGVGCASDVPGVYARMSHFTQWINEN